jgi:hypothetical protein
MDVVKMHLNELKQEFTAGKLNVESIIAKFMLLKTLQQEQDKYDNEVGSLNDSGIELSAKEINERINLTFKNQIQIKKVYNCLSWFLSKQLITYEMVRQQDSEKKIRQYHLTQEGNDILVKFFDFLLNIKMLPELKPNNPYRLNWQTPK